MKMSEAEFIFRSTNTRQVLIVVVDTGILGSVANSLQERSFASIGATDYKDAKASIFRSEVITVVHCRLCVRVKRLRGNVAVEFVFTGSGCCLMSSC